MYQQQRNPNSKSQMQSYHSYKSTQKSSTNILQHQLYTFEQHLTANYQTLLVNCNTLNNKIYQMQTLINDLLHKMQTKDDTLMIQTLRIKQDALIISDLQDKLNKANRKLNMLTIELNQNQIELENYRNQMLELSTKMEQDTLQRRSLNYTQLEHKLTDLQGEFDNKLENYIASNTILKKQLDDLNRKYEDQGNRMKQICQVNQLLKGTISNLQLRVKQEQQLRKSIQIKHLSCAQRINKIETQLQQQKRLKQTILNEHKSQEKIVVNKIRQMILQLNQISREQVQPFEKGVIGNVDELKRLFQRFNIHKIQQMTTRLISLEEKLIMNQTLLEDKSKRIAALENSLSEQKTSNQNGSFKCSSNNDRSEADEKYRSRLETLRKDVKAKQSTINQLQAIQQSQYDKFREKILSLQLQLAQKQTQHRMLSFKVKDRETQYNELLKSSAANRQRIAELTQGYEQKLAAVSITHETAIGTMEKKLRDLRAEKKDIDHSEQQLTIKYNKLKAKYEKMSLQNQTNTKRRNQRCEQLSRNCQQLTRNYQKLKYENDILSQKIRIVQMINSSNKQITADKPQLKMATELQQLKTKCSHISKQNQLKAKQINKLNKILTAKQQQLIQCESVRKQLQNNIQQLIKQREGLTSTLQTVHNELVEKRDIEQTKKQQQHSILKKQLQKSIISNKKLQRDRSKQKKYMDNLQKKVEHLQGANKQLTTQLSKLKEKNDKLVSELAISADTLKRWQSSYEQKLVQQSLRETQLVNIINFKNRDESHNLRESMIGDEQLMSSSKTQTTRQRIQRVNVGVQIKVQSKQWGDGFIPSTVQCAINTQPEVDSKILIDGFFEEGSIIKDQPQQIIVNHLAEQASPLALVPTLDTAHSPNLFSNLVAADNFQICDSRQQVDINQRTTNLQIKQVFNKLRKQIQRVFNEQDISMSLLQILPKQLQDDYYEFIAYLKQRLSEIKKQNNLSFIMVDVEEDSIQFRNNLEVLFQKDGTSLKQVQSLRQLVEEKQHIIVSLLSERTQQQMTINQLTIEKQQTEQQHQNRFMNKCNVYKRQIREHKRTIDAQDMNLQSLRNIFRNVLEIYSDSQQNQDDLRDNLFLYANLVKLTENERARTQYYLRRYMQLRGFQ